VSRRKPSGRSSLASSSLDTTGLEALTGLSEEHEASVTFSQHCRRLVQLGLDNYVPEDGDSAESVPWLESADRTAEAMGVEPCVTRFVEAELESRRVGIGRYSAHTPYSKSFGFRYQGRLQPVDSRLSAADLITLTLAVGYLGPMFAQSTTLHLDSYTTANVELIWNFWVVRLFSDFPVHAVGEDITKQTKAQGTDAFCTGARLLGIKAIGRGSGAFGVRALGDFYASAGMVLRIAQSLSLSEDDILTKGWKDFVNYWPWASQ